MTPLDLCMGKKRHVFSFFLKKDSKRPDEHTGSAAVAATEEGCVAPVERRSVDSSGVDGARG